MLTPGSFVAEAFREGPRNLQSWIVRALSHWSIVIVNRRLVTWFFLIHHVYFLRTYAYLTDWHCLYNHLILKFWMSWERTWNPATWYMGGKDTWISQYSVANFSSSSPFWKFIWSVKCVYTSLSIHIYIYIYIYIHIYIYYILYIYIYDSVQDISLQTLSRGG